MPIEIRKLAGDEAARYFPGRRGGVNARDLGAYVEGLRGFAAGDVGEVEPGDAGQRATKRRVTIAAKQLGLTLQWSKRLMGDGSIGFRVGQAPTAATPGRRGRPPKSADA